MNYLHRKCSASQCIRGSYLKVHHICSIFCHLVHRYISDLFFFYRIFLSHQLSAMNFIDLLASCVTECNIASKYLFFFNFFFSLIHIESLSIHQNFFSTVARFHESLLNLTKVYFFNLMAHLSLKMNSHITSSSLIYLHIIPL